LIVDSGRLFDGKVNGTRDAYGREVTITVSVTTSESFVFDAMDAFIVKGAR
jgi:hypothetical protein